MRYGTGVLLVVAAGLIWSLQGLAFRQIASTDTWAVLFWRSAGTLAALIVLLSLTAGRAPLAAMRRAGIPGVAGGIGLVFAFAGSIYAMQATTIANAVFLFSASPFFAAILGWILLGERVRPATWAAIGLAAFGMWVMVRGGLADGALAGNVAALVSALGFAGFTVALRWGRLTEMLPAVALGAVFAALTAAAVQGARGASLALPPADIAITMAIGAGIVGLGLAMYTYGSRGIPAAELTLLSQIEVLLGPVWVFVFLNESASAATFAGGAILTAAVVFNGLSGAALLARRGRAVALRDSD